MADPNLAATLGTEYARMIHGILPRIEDAMIKRGKKTATFTVSAKFSVIAGGDVQVILQPSASIPMDTAAFKLEAQGGQLSLFEGPPA